MALWRNRKPSRTLMCSAGWCQIEAGGRLVVKMTQTQTQPLVSQEAALNAKAAAECALITLDPEGTVRFWSPGAQRIKGYAATEIIGQNFSCLYTDAARKAGEPQRTLAIAAARGKYETEGLRVR